MMEYTAALVSGAAALLLYLNTLDADFAYDDSRAIQKNPDLLPETPIMNIFYNDFWGTPLTHSGSHKSYRPLCVLSFRLNYYFGGLNPWGYHLGNVLLHVAVTMLFTYFSQTFLHYTFPTLVAGLLFATHPVHTEAVAGVVGRADVGACLFFILGFLSYRQYIWYRDGRLGRGAPLSVSWSTAPSSALRFFYFLATVLLTMASMLTKEQGVTVLGVCASYELFIQWKMSLSQVLQTLKQRKSQRFLEGILLLILCGSGLVILRIYLMGNKPPEFAPSDNPASDSKCIFTRLLTFLYLPVLNFYLLLCPSVLSFDWSMNAIPLVESLVDVRNFFTFLFYFGLAYTIHRILQAYQSSLGPKLHENGNGCLYDPCSSSNHKHNNNLFSKGKILSNCELASKHQEDFSPDRSAIHTLIISLALLIFPFIPATNLFFYVGFVLAERILYIPSMGFCLLVAKGVECLHRRCHSDQLRKTLLIVCLGILLLSFTVRTILRNRDWQSEEKLYQSGITVNPAKAWGNLANILNSQGKSREAEEAYRNALKYRSNMADVHYNLGILLQDQKRYQEAIESYKMAIRCRPKLTVAYLNLGIVLGLLGLHKEAEQSYMHCAQLDTSGLKDPRLHEGTKISALYNLGRLYAEQENYQLAVKTYEEALRRRPHYYGPQSIYNMMGEAYAKMGQLKRAEHWYQEALKAKPDHLPAHLTLAKLYHKKNQLSEAEKWFKKAIMFDPTDGTAYHHYAQFFGELGRYAESADVYQEALTKAKEDFELLFNSANAMRQAGKNEEAELLYKRAVRLGPDIATAHMNLGAMLHFNGKLNEAEKSYQTALRLKPDDAMTRDNLVKLRNLMNKKSTR